MLSEAHVSRVERVETHVQPAEHSFQPPCRVLQLFQHQPANLFNTTTEMACVGRQDRGSSTKGSVEYKEGGAEERARSNMFIGVRDANCTDRSRPNDDNL